MRHPGSVSCRAAALALLLVASCAPVGASEDAFVDQWRALEIEATPVDFGAERVGELAFRGGLALASDYGWFGGLSGLEVFADHRFLAVSDRADWFEGRLVLDEEGRLVGVDDVRTAMMRDENATPFDSRESGDSEALAQLPDGRFAVSFEHSQSIRLYDFNRDGPFGAAQSGPPLGETARLPGNAGLEALAATEAGELIVGAEGGGGRTPIWRVRLDALQPVAPIGHYQLRDGFSLTGLDRLPNGDFIAIERFYAPVIGARARVARFSAAELVAGATIRPRRLAEIAPPLAVDNFESVAAVPLPNGGTRLYIVSDDNMSDRQRTLLLAFDIVE
jgi:hypothetical protein